MLSTFHPPRHTAPPPSLCAPGRLLLRAAPLPVPPSPQPSLGTLTSGLHLCTILLSRVTRSKHPLCRCMDLITKGHRVRHEVSLVQNLPALPAAFEAPSFSGVVLLPPSTRRPCWPLTCPVAPLCSRACCLLQAGEPPLCSARLFTNRALTKPPLHTGACRTTKLFPKLGRCRARIWHYPGPTRVWLLLDTRILTRLFKDGIELSGKQS